MTDSLSNEKDNQHAKAIKFALKASAGHISSRTPVAMAVRAILEKKPEEVKKSELDLNSLSAANLCGELFAINKDWVNWRPETLWKEFKCNDVTKNKIRAIQTLLTTPNIQFDTHGFYNVIKAFNNEISDWSVIYPIPCEEIVFGMDQINKIHKIELWPEVEAFIRVCMIHDGLIWLPWLDIEEKNGLDFDTNKLKLVWEKSKDNDIQFSESDLFKPLNVQIFKLKDIYSYMKAMA